MSRESFTSWNQHLETATRSAVWTTEPASRDVAALTILAHPDLRRIGERALILDDASPLPVLISRLEPLFAASGRQRRRPLGDPHLSRQPIRLLRLATGDFRLDLSQTRTRVRIEARPPRDGEILPAAALTRGLVLTLSNRVALLLHRVDPTTGTEPDTLGLVGESRAIADVRRQILRVAEHDVSVMIRGETGTGKELVARAIHRVSARRAGPFVAVNMGAIPPSLAAAELFGATKGAFTGADRSRPGRFRKADGGSLLLDEIGETPPEIQVLLLRALETRRIQPVGDEKEYDVDVRILAATDAHLEQAMEEERFRAPLLHRLSGYELHLPPLRARRDDIPRLLLHFLRLELEALGEVERLEASVDTPSPWLSADLVTRLVLFSWEGNVRRLRNMVRQLLVARSGAEPLRPTPEIEEQLRRDETKRARLAPSVGAGDSTTDLEEPPERPRPDRGMSVASKGQSADDRTPPAARIRPYRSPQDVSEDELVAALRAHRFRILPTAEALGVSRGSLYNLIDRCSRVRKAADLTAREIEDSRARHDGELDAMAAELEVSRKGLSRRMTELGL